MRSGALYDMHLQEFLSHRIAGFCSHLSDSIASRSGSLPIAPAPPNVAELDCVTAADRATI